MTGYLTNLVDRINQQPPAVRPRPVALFEPQVRIDPLPWVTAGHSTAETGPPMEQSGTLQTGEPAPARSQPPAVPTPPRQLPAPVKPRPPTLTTRSSQKPATAAPVEPPAPLGYLLHRPALPVDPLPRDPGQRPPLPSTPAGGPSLEPADASYPKLGPPHPLPPGETASARPGPREPGAAISIRPRPRETSATTSIRPSPRTPTRSPRPARTGSHRSTQGDRSPPEPVINVTIGRVEIVATPPPGTARTGPPDRPSPVTSLEEYLKSRDQEGQK
jgi:hypothetical protein